MATRPLNAAAAAAAATIRDDDAKLLLGFSASQGAATSGENMSYFVVKRDIDD